MRWIKGNKNIMESKELRIGNWINDGYSDRKVKIDDFANECIFFPETPMQKWSPIELTEEWLERFGFTKVNHKGFNGYLSGNCELIYNIESKQMFSFNEVDGSVWNLTRVIFIHQLQNLYYALTGEELKYSLNSTPNKEES